MATMGPRKRKQLAVELCDGIGVLNAQAVELAENVLFMADKLEATRAKIATSDIVIPYNNGGGQTGIRENPMYSAYEKLLTCYTKSLRQLDEMVRAGRPTPKAIDKLGELRLITGMKVG